MRAELQMPLGRANRVLLSNLAKAGIVDAAIWVAVAYDVESVERIEPESDRLLSDNVKVLERGHVHVEVSGTSN